ncbi:MAG: hypothetical protein QNJ31_02835 [Candidatus Caenarcaniphilales bacterium]|nr:hypothetical protein [Candidatus Caenarcaniphilales bacterium]
MSDSIASLVSLVGRYEREAKYRNEEDDLHIISVDEEESTVFVDFNSAPEWLSIKRENDQIVIDKKYQLNSERMTYKVLDSSFS